MVKTANFWPILANAGKVRWCLMICTTFICKEHSYKYFHPHYQMGHLRSEESRGVFRVNQLVSGSVEMCSYGLFRGDPFNFIRRVESHTAWWNPRPTESGQYFLANRRIFWYVKVFLIPSPPQGRLCLLCADERLPLVWIMAAFTGWKASGATALEGLPTHASTSTACSTVSKPQAVGSNWSGFSFCLSYVQLCYGGQIPCKPKFLACELE